MGSFSKLVQTNIILSIFFIVAAFAYPLLNKSVFYKGKQSEAISVCKKIAEKEEENYANKNNYIPLKKGDLSELSSKFDFDKKQIKFYDYSVITHFNKYKIIAEPKVKYLKSREIPPKIYSYSKGLNSSEAIKKWQ
jgi:Tfp pilus assembly protein PilE